MSTVISQVSPQGRPTPAPNPCSVRIVISQVSPLGRPTPAPTEHKVSRPQILN